LLGKKTIWVGLLILFLLCGRPAGHITHFARPSVRLSVSPSVPYGKLALKIG